MTSMAEECRAPLVVDDPESAFEDVQPQRRSLNISRVWKAAALVTGGCALATIAVQRTGAPGRTQHQVDGITQLAEDKECIQAFEGPCESDGDCCGGGTCVEENEFWKGCKPSKPAGDDEGAGRGEEAAAPEVAPCEKYKAVVEDKRCKGEPLKRFKGPKGKTLDECYEECVSTEGCTYFASWPEDNPGEGKNDCRLYGGDCSDKVDLNAGYRNTVYKLEDCSEAEAGDKGDAGEPDASTSSAEAAGTTGCCYSIGYGSMMVPCCLKTTEGVEESACETGDKIGGAGGWVEGACPTSAEEAAGLLNPEGSETTGGPAVLPETTAAPGVLPGTAGPPAVLPETTEEPGVLPGTAGPPAVLPETTDAMPEVLPETSAPEKACIIAWHGTCADDSSCCDGLTCSTVNPYWSQCVPKEEEGGCMKEWQGQCETHADCCEHLICADDNGWKMCSPPECTKSGEDCSQTHCCSEAGMTCYKKNEWWSSCNATCSSNSLWDQDAGKWVDTDEVHWECEAYGPATPEGGWTEVPEHTKEKVKKEKKKKEKKNAVVASSVAEVVSNATEDLGNVTGNMSLDIPEDLGNVTGNMSLDIPEDLGNVTGNMSLDIPEEAAESTTVAAL